MRKLFARKVDVIVFEDVAIRADKARVGRRWTRVWYPDGAVVRYPNSAIVRIVERAVEGVDDD